MSIEWREICIKLDSRIVADLRDSVGIRGMLGNTSLVESTWAKILRAMSEGKDNIEIRYKSDDPNFRRG